MSDQQFSIKNPFGPGRVFMDCFGGPEEYLIDAGGKEIRFEWSGRFGPMPIFKNGKVRDLSHRHLFWRAASLWNIQGRKLEGSKAIWREPQKPIYEKERERGGWLITKVVHEGEEGYDW